MKQMMDLMSQMLDVTNQMAENTSETMGVILDGIANESERIVYTEQLIDDMGVQIGSMADRIVHTENIVADMLSSCAMCNHSIGDATKPNRQDTSHFSSIKNPDIVFDPAFNPKQSNPTSAVPRSDNPWDDMIETMDHALDLMTQISANTTFDLDNEVFAIGSMSNRIVSVECLIMDMSKQIGVMADRIVYTEEMLANVSTDCCHPRATARTSRRRTPAPTPAPTLPVHCTPYPSISPVHGRSLQPSPSPAFLEAQSDVLNRLQLGRRQALLDSRSGIPGPFDLAAAAMEKMMDEMLDVMAKMATSSSAMIINGTFTIGSLADDIVASAAVIDALVLNIGKVADCIVESESIGLALFGRICSKAPVVPINGTCPSITPVPPPAAVGKSLLPPTTTATPTPAGAVPLDGPFGDFAEMVSLCTKMLNTMISLSSLMGSDCRNVLKQINAMGGRVFKTVKKISQMVVQINQMADRIAQSTAILAKLARQCHAV
jgi:hypothetical protein